MNRHLKLLIQKHKDNRASIRGRRYDHARFHDLGNLRLTTEEKAAIKDKWGEIAHCPLSRGYNFFIGMKSLGRFDPNYLPCSYYNPYIWQTLNDRRFSKLISHKAFIEKIFDLGIRHPETVLRSFGGYLFDGSFTPLTLTEAMKVLASENSELIFKIASETCQGLGVKLIKPADIPSFVKSIEDGSIFDGGDFIIQRLVEQSEDTKIFNPDSLNTMRITSFKLNGEVTIGTRGLKCGARGSLVDNIGETKRGVMVGIDPDGNIADFGFYGNGEKSYTHNGVEFKGRKIRGFHKVLEAVTELHNHVDSCKIIGWDIAVDKDNEPVLIEGNSVYPGLGMGQMVTGPVFGHRTDEMIEYLKAHPYQPLGPS